VRMSTLQRDAKPKKKALRRSQGVTPPYRVYCRTPTLQLCRGAACFVLAHAARACFGDARCFAHLIGWAVKFQCVGRMPFGGH
jgi:hypothetical protein